MAVTQHCANFPHATPGAVYILDISGESVHAYMYMNMHLYSTCFCEHMHACWCVYMCLGELHVCMYCACTVCIIYNTVRRSIADISYQGAKRRGKYAAEDIEAMD